MSWKLRIDYLRYAPPTFASGRAENRPGGLFGSQTLSGAGVPAVLSSPAPAFGDPAGGFARITVLAGAVLLAWGGASPQVTEVGGLRLEAGQSETVAVQTGDRIAGAEAADGPATGSSQSYALLTNGSATGASLSSLPAGSYVWAVQGSFGGATVALQVLGPDGATWMTVSSKTAPDTGAATGVVLGANATVRAQVTGGTPTALYSTLG